MKHIFTVKALLLFSCVDFCHSRSLRLRTITTHEERQLERVCPFPEFEDAPWEATVKYPENIAEAHGKMLGKDFVLLAGFVNGFKATTQSTYAMDVDAFPGSGAAWRKMDDYPGNPAVSHAAVTTVGENLIYMLGGYVGGEPGQHTPMGFVYDHSKAPGTGQYTRLPDMPDGRAAGAAFYDSLTNAVYYATGARRPVVGNIYTVDYFDTWRLPLGEDGYPLNGADTQWETVAPCIYKANHISYVTAYDENQNERHIVLGGQDGANESGGNYATVVEYIPEIDGPGRWEYLQDMPEGRGHSSSSTIAWGCGFFTSGGALNGGIQTDSIIYYDFPTNAWYDIDTLPLKYNVPICGLRNDYMHCEMPFGQTTYRRKVIARYPDSISPPTISPTIAPPPTTPAPTSQFEIRINAGSSQSGVDSNGKFWEGDKYFTYGWTPSTSGTIQNCDPDDYFIFSTARHTGSLGMNYDIPVPNGKFRVILYYNEFWHSDRLFDLYVEDVFFDNFSLVALAGGTMKAYKYELENLVVVDDGQLNIVLQAVVKGGLLNGIEIIQVFDAPVLTPTASPTVLTTDSSPTPVPTAGPTVSPAEAPTASPTEMPTSSPTISPAEPSTAAPADEPTLSPTVSPTDPPTGLPTDAPTVSPTKSPTTFQTSPTEGPTLSPSSPTRAPTIAISAAPTILVSAAPSAAVFPTNSPTRSPTESPTNFPSASAPAPPAFEIRINAGSNEGGVDSNGNEWIADEYFEFGWTPSTSGNIANCDPADKFIFSSARHTGGPGLFYDVPVPNGIYKVNLYYNEFWHSDRVFDLKVEDKVFDDLSLVNLAGGIMKAYIFEIPNVIVHDNILTIELQQVVKGGLVSGVEIISMPSAGGLPTYAPTVSPTATPTCSPTESLTLPAGATPAPTSNPMFEIRVNAGSTQGGVDSAGNTWIADKYFLYGWTPSTTGTVKNAPPKDQFIYQSGRHTGGPGLFYNIPVPNGVYQVNLYYNEFWHSDRIFNLNVEDKVFNNLSLVHLAGGTMTAYIYQIPNVVVNDGVITIQLQSVVRGGLVNGVEVIQVA